MKSKRDQNRSFSLCNFFLKSRKGELSTQQLILLIILIASFAVILFLIFRMDFGGTGSKEVCHNSVVLRGSSTLPKESIPLNCKTSYTCITKDGSCEEMGGDRQIKKAQTKDDVYKILANEMTDCWWMFGEGKLNYVGKDLPANNLYCSICSQIAFDNSLNGIFTEREIDKKEFYDYLSKTNVSGKTKSYLDYLLDMKTSEEIKSTLQNADSEFGKINLEKQHYVVMGIASDVNTLGWILAGAGVGAGIVIIVSTAGLGTPVAIAVAGGAVAGAVGGHFIGTMVKGDSGDFYMPPVIIEANSADFDKLDCVEIKTLA